MSGSPSQMGTPTFWQPHISVGTLDVQTSGLGGGGWSIRKAPSALSLNGLALEEALFGKFLLFHCDGAGDGAKPLAVVSL